MIRTRVPETGDASGKNGKGKDDADVDDKRCDEKLRFVGSRQASNRIQEELEPRKSILHSSFEAHHQSLSRQLLLSKKNPPKASTGNSEMIVAKL